MGVQDSWVVDLIIIVTLLCFQTPVLSFQNLTCNPNDFHALQDFMKGLTTKLDGWGNELSSDCCTWPGITCKSSSSLGLNDFTDTYRVVKLELPSKRIYGNFSESLGNLEQLRTLNLSHNFFKSSLPISLFHLPNIELLDLSFNDISGPIPVAIHLPNIQLLDLSFNDISGPIPVAIHLPSIQSIDISENMLRGTLPASICVNSYHLRILNLGVNYLSGSLPPGLGSCKSLQDLRLDVNYLTSGWNQGNKFSGPMAEVFGNLSNLVHLDISGNWFSGTIPDIFDSLGRLQIFIAHSNHFSGRIPASLSNSRTISLLNVRNNSPEGTIDLNCSAMTSLITLNLGSNRFDGPVPSNLPSCRHLENVNLARNNFSGQIPESFQNFHTLAYLSISNSNIYKLSAALHILQKCRNLTGLVLTMNFLDEEFPADSTLHFEKLKILIIANSQLRGSIPQWLSGSSNLQLLDISWNNLEGTIPDWFGGFRRLFYVDISNNSLSGHIPRSITALENLIDCKISLEEPSYDFPLFTKKNLRESGLQYNQVYSFPPTLDFSNNNLSGPIWPEFGNLKSLHVLDLGFNSLSGTIPSSLSKMANLEALDLQHNKLSGTIPPSLVQLSFLSKLSVADNQLEGEIPTGGQFMTFPESSFQGNNLRGVHVSPCALEFKPEDVDSEKTGKSSRVELEVDGVCVGVAVGFIFGILCFIRTSKYCWI